MAKTVEKVEGPESSWIETGQRPDAAEQAAPEYARLLDVIREPIILLDNNHEIIYGNRAAQERFNLKQAQATCYAILRGRESACEECPVTEVEPGETIPVELVKDEKKHRLSIHRLSEPIGDAWYVMRLEIPASGVSLDPGAVRRMKHRFNNYLAPMAGQAEIIIFALEKGDHAKVRKAVSQILEHAEDSTAVDALFDPEPWQESTSITYYVD